MKQSSKRLVSLGLALFFVIASLVILFDFIEPEYANVINAKSQVSGEQAFLDSETKAVAQAQTLLSTFEGQGQQDQNVSLAMPSSEDQAGALAQIYGIAQNNGLTITTVGVAAPTIQTPTPTGSAPSLTKPIGSISFQITGTGSYESMKNFLEEIETNVRLFDLESISITQASSGGAVKDIFNYNITLLSYYQTN